MKIGFYDRQETISTCRFAQRVALVKNYAKLSLEQDLNGENTLLKLENEKLRKEIGELMRINDTLKNALSSQDNRDDFERKLDYYKNLVFQRDQEICIFFFQNYYLLSHFFFFFFLFDRTQIFSIYTVTQVEKPSYWVC